MKNRFDSRNRDAREIVADLTKEKRRLAIVGSKNLEQAGRLVAGLRAQWSEIVELVGFEPERIVTGDAIGGAEKAARLLARSVTGKLAAVFHRADLLHRSQSEMFLNILLARTSDAALILATSGKPTCMPLRHSLTEWGKKYYQVEVG